MKALKEDGDELKYASEELREDKEVVLEALKGQKERLKDEIKGNLIKTSLLNLAGEELKNNSQFIVEALMGIFGVDNQLHNATKISQAIQPSQHDLMDVMQEMVDDRNPQRTTQGVPNLGEQPEGEER